MQKKIERFSNETNRIESYTLVKIREKFEIKHESFEAKHTYYQRESDGELFEPFENPDFNLNKDYDLFRTKHQLLSPKAVKKIRKKYHLSLRDFSKLLGISYGNLSAIENGSIQADYIDNLLRLVDHPKAFLKLISEKPGVIAKKTEDTLKSELQGIIYPPCIKIY